MPKERSNNYTINYSGKATGTTTSTSNNVALTNMEDGVYNIEIIDNKYRIISSKPKANAYKVFWKEGKFFEEKIKKSKDFLLLSDLLKK